jgi:hypothetical protein
MPATYTWSVIKIEANRDYNGYENVVRSVNWMLIADLDGNKKPLAGQTILSDPSDPFIEFSLLTEQDVLNWVFQTIGPDKKNKLETMLSESIVASPTINLPLPWI